MAGESHLIDIIKDEPSLTMTLRDTLESEGYEVRVHKNGDEAIQHFTHSLPDLLLLGIELTDINGYDLCRKIRSRNYTFPVIILTSRENVTDRVTGLNMGADDVITKPFDTKELLARIKACLRRTEAYTVTGPSEILNLDAIEVNLSKGTVNRPDGDIELTSKEINLLNYLKKNVNKAVTRQDLLKKVWYYEHSTQTRTVDVHISKLRNKIEMDPRDPSFLITLHGVGYMLKM